MINKNLKKIVNDVGTPAIGYTIGGIPGIIASMLPDVAQLPFLRNYKDFHGNKPFSLINDFLHSVYPPAITALATGSWKLGVAMASHIALDYLTHDSYSHPFFKGYKPFILGKGIHERNEGEKVVLLYSAGLDSFIADFLFHPEVLLNVKIGSRYEDKENLFLKRQCNDLQISDRLVTEDLGFLGKFENANAFVPLRNMYFLMIGSHYGDRVMLSALKGETSTDKSEGFRNNLERTINDLKIKPTKITFPFKRFTKTQILKMYLENSGNADLLREYTVSCYDKAHVRCGNCISCFRRWVAEENNNLNTTSLYRNNPADFGRILFQVYRNEHKGAKMYLDKNFWVNIPSNFDAYKALKKEGGNGI